MSKTKPVVITNLAPPDPNDFVSAQNALQFGQMKSPVLTLGGMSWSGMGRTSSPGPSGYTPPPGPNYRWDQSLHAWVMNDAMKMEFDLLQDIQTLSKKEEEIDQKIEALRQMPDIDPLTLYSKPYVPMTWKERFRTIFKRKKNTTE